MSKVIACSCRMTRGCATLILANGFSCREQIEQATGRHALHLADVLAAAISAA